MDAFLPITEVPLAVEDKKSKKEVQARLTEIIHDDKYTNLVAELTVEDSAESRMRLAELLSAGKSGGAWLEASPALPYYRLSDEELTLALVSDAARRPAHQAMHLHPVWAADGRLRAPRVRQAHLHDGQGVQPAQEGERRTRTHVP